MYIIRLEQAVGDKLNQYICIYCWNWCGTKSIGVVCNFNYILRKNKYIFIIAPDILSDKYCSPNPMLKTWDETVDQWDKLLFGLRRASQWAIISYILQGQIQEFPNGGML